MNDLTNYFPGLARSAFRVTSPRTVSYNCLAWAACDKERWWWPDALGLYYWPPGAARRETLAAFEEAYGQLAYEVCQDGAVEEGFEKIALFVDDYGRPTHAARQLRGGSWTSKCGKLEDIEHDLAALSGESYGQIARYLKRRVP